MPYIRADVKNVYGKSTVCVCPKCRKIHKYVIDWKGRGVPRKFCQKCLQSLDSITGGIDDDVAFHKYALQYSARRV